MENNTFFFSIIVPVYNCAAYLEETVRSVTDQSLPFTEYVQLILVNDGSTDNSGEICEKFRDLYKQNVVYIAKENGGVSAARNAGMAAAKGRYIGFLDSDDLYGKTVLEQVRAFFTQTPHPPKLASIHLEKFEAAEGCWPLNDRFFKKTRILDLMDEPEYIQLNVCCTFFECSAAAGFCFSHSYKLLEDAHYLYRFFLKYPRTGLVSGPAYWHRVRKDQSSATQNLDYAPTALSLTGHLFKDLLNISADTLGSPPLFLQHMIVHELMYYVAECGITAKSSCGQRQQIIDNMRFILDRINVTGMLDAKLLRGGDAMLLPLLHENASRVFDKRLCKKRSLHNAPRAYGVPYTYWLSRIYWAVRKAFYAAWNGFWALLAAILKRYPGFHKFIRKILRRE